MMMIAIIVYIYMRIHIHKIYYSNEENMILYFYKCIFLYVMCIRLINK
jgi:uncharacterized membrane protein (DUF106 family)